MPLMDDNAVFRPRSDEAKIKLFLYAVKYGPPLYRPHSHIRFLPPRLLSKRRPELALRPEGLLC